MEEDGEVFHASPQERRLLVIGKTGNGKSSVGNIILGSRHFEVGCSMTSTTVKPASGVATFDGIKVKVVDTPDITNLGLVDNDDAQREICTWKALMSPEPHAILLAVRCDVRYTREEHEIFLRLKTLWGCNSFCRRLVVAFTFGDRQDEDLGRELQLVCSELKSVLKDASHRYVLFNDRDSQQGKGQQVKNLLELVQRLDTEVMRSEERSLLTGVQVCPQGPSVSASQLACKRVGSPLSRQSSGGSSRGSSSTDADAIRLLLVGRAGTGKSSTGNTILGREEFPVYNHKHAGHTASRHEVQIDGRTFQVIDTPGLQTEREDAEYQRERRAASELAQPGPHALLFVLRHRHVTDDDLSGFRTLTQQLGQGLSHHTVVVLVGRPNDQVRGSGSGSCLPLTSAHQQVSGFPPELLGGGGGGVEHDEGMVFQALLEEAGGKLWVVDNTMKDSRARQAQVDALLKTVYGILDNTGGHCFHGDQVAKEMAEARQAQEKGSYRARKGSCWFL